MLCPADRTPLIPHQREGVQARSCLQCHGVWFSRDALESLVRKASQTGSGDPPKPSSGASFLMRRLVCPTCAGSQLQTRMQGAVEISRCRDCGGIWLAKTEVAKILSARMSRPVTTSQSSGATKGAVTGIGADMADRLGEATPLVALEASGEIGSAVGDFLASFLG